MAQEESGRPRIPGIPDGSSRLLLLELGQRDPVIPLLYYISGHGYGHAVRSAQVMRGLKEACPEVKFHVRTPVPSWFLQQDLPFPVYHADRRLDVGIVQTDSLEMNVRGTLEACRLLHDRASGLLEEEIAFVRKEKIRLILGDIPPLCFEVASRASVPSVAVGNFTWDWIYRSYLQDFPSFLPVVRHAEGCYRKASLALVLPFSCDMGIFPRWEPIPLISRISALDKTEARKRFSFPLSARIVLVSFGGLGLERLPWEKLARSGDFLFVTTGRFARADEKLIVLPEAQPHYEELVRAADVVVGKPGYGTVSEVIAHRVPLLYTSRGNFPEYPFLVRALEEWATCEFIPREDLLAGEMAPYLERLLAKEPHWPALPLNGAQVAAEAILNVLKQDR